MICYVSLELFWLIFFRIIFGFEVTAENSNVGLILKEFPLLENAVLSCGSVDEKHNFDYWYHANSNDIIGPNNQGDFDYFKYGYEVLSGNLTIRNINKHDSGLYNCVSRGVTSDSTKIASIKVSVVGSIKEPEEEVNALKIILAICSLILFCCFMYAAYRVWKDRYMYPRYLEQFDEEDDVGENEDIYRAPSTSGIIRQSIVKEKPTKQQEGAKDNERPLISTDFESILDSRI